MTGQSSPAFGDIAHVGHVELFTPKPDESLKFFRSVVGSVQANRGGRTSGAPVATQAGTRVTISSIANWRFDGSQAASAAMASASSASRPVSQSISVSVRVIVVHT